jgi:hypothetical protein
MPGAGLAELTRLLADDAVLVVDASATYGRVRDLTGPLIGATKVAAFRCGRHVTVRDGTRDTDMGAQWSARSARPAGRPTVYGDPPVSIRAEDCGRVHEADSARLGYVDPARLSALTTRLQP